MEKIVTVKTEVEKALAEKLQNNLVKYENLTYGKQVFMRRQQNVCQYLDGGGKWIQVFGFTHNGRYRIDPSVNIIVEPEQEPEPDDDIIAKLDAIISEAEDTNAFYELGEVIKELHDRISKLENERKQ